MESSTLYTADGLKALKLQLTSTTAETTHSFSPQFVYPIFGEQEVIYGYRDLVIKLYAAAGSLVNYLGIDYLGEPVAGDRALDIEKTLYEFIPPDYTKNIEVFKKTVKKDEDSFKPIGNKIGEYARRKKAQDETVPDVKGKGKAKVNGNASYLGASKEEWENCDITDEGAIVYEAYHTRFDTPKFREYHRRMQIFVLLFIEGGSYIDEDDERWELVTLFEKRKHATKKDKYTYHFVGYTSLYRFLHWPDKIRLRLSQFIILPPFQGMGHGSTFYTLVYMSILQRSEIAELTIEDPSEAFQEMRDKVDFRTLTSAGVFERKKAPINAKWREDARAEWKLGKRQFGRVLELALRRGVNKIKDTAASGVASKAKDAREAERQYRLLVKERLHRQNYELLADMEPHERKESLANTYDSVVDEYDKLLGQLHP